MAHYVSQGTLGQRRRRAAAIGLIGVALLGAIAAVGLIADAGARAKDVDGRRPPQESEQHYLAAAADREAFASVRCYCGCEASLAHRNLLDCFITPEGRWEPHASGCGVCIAEAIDVTRLRQEGVPMDAIVRHIDARFSPILTGG